MYKMCLCYISLEHVLNVKSLRPIQDVNKLLPVYKIIVITIILLL